MRPHTPSGSRTIKLALDGDGGIQEITASLCEIGDIVYRHPDPTMGIFPSFFPPRFITPLKREKACREADFFDSRQSSVCLRPAQTRAVYFLVQLQNRAALPNKGNRSPFSSTSMGPQITLSASVMCFSKSPTSEATWGWRWISSGKGVPSSNFWKTTML